MIKDLPIFLSMPCFVVGIPVALAIVRLITSTPNALLVENDVPGILKIFIYNHYYLLQLQSTAVLIARVMASPTNAISANI